MWLTFGCGIDSIVQNGSKGKVDPLKPYKPIYLLEDTASKTTCENHYDPGTQLVNPLIYCSEHATIHQISKFGTADQFSLRENRPCFLFFFAYMLIY